jgi:hypothetical protein
LLKNDSPLVATGLDDMIKNTHVVITADADGEVIYVD